MDCLNDCETHYCLAMEEQYQYWVREKAKNTLEKKMLCIISCMHDEGKDYSTANYCLTTDKGYSHLATMDALEDKG